MNNSFNRFPVFKFSAARRYVFCCFTLLLSLTSPWVNAQDVQLLTVIVEMKTPFIPEGELTGAGVVKQRAAIVADRNYIMNSLLAGTILKNTYVTIPAFAVKISPANLTYLQLNSRVKSITVDSAMEPFLSTSRVVMGVPTAEAAGYDGTGAVVAVLDTGVDKNHPALSGKVVSEACYSTTDSARKYESLCPNGANSTATDSALPSCSFDSCDHGTHVAGIVAANGTVKGIAAGAKLIAIQVFSKVSDTATCEASRRSTPCLLVNFSDYLGGLDRVVALSENFNIASVNMSFGGGFYSAACDSSPPAAHVDALENLRSKNIAPVAAAGNGDSSTAIAWPACMSAMIAVGNTTKSDKVYHGEYGTNSSSLLKFWAPGREITSTCFNGKTCVKSGTSMAAPHIAGVYAVMRHFLGVKPVDEVTKLLESNGVQITDSTNSVTKPRPDLGKITYSNAGPLPAAPVLEGESAYCGGKVFLNWSTVSTATSYQLYRSITQIRGAATDFYKVKTTTGTEVADDGPSKSDESARYNVRACNENGCGEASNIVGTFSYYQICQ